jgi:hypothetical protein
MANPSPYAPSVSDKAPSDASRGPVFWASFTTAGTDIVLNTSHSIAKWPASYIRAVGTAAGNLVFAGEDDVDATAEFDGPVVLRGSIKKIDATTTSGTRLLVGWCSR